MILLRVKSLKSSTSRKQKLIVHVYVVIYSAKNNQKGGLHDSVKRFPQMFCKG